ncbi:MAG: Non-motile and phage-resistance protein [Smithella sp. PtaU1.Bin162]|nr:MAG: Non-motile and phage-resistance protein [Smithella sp. PtaU1.Bin162]
MAIHEKNFRQPSAITILLKLSKQVFVLILALLLSTSLVYAEKRIVKVGVYENAPKVFTDESGDPSGIFIDVIEYIAEKENWDLQYVSGTWVEGLDRLAKGEIDLMPDVAYTVDREKIYSFHKVPILSSWYQVYAPKGSNIRSLLDLSKKKILVLERSVQQQAFTKLSKGFGLEVTLISVPDYKAMFEKVAGNEAHAAITNRFYGIMHAKTFGLEDTGIVFEPSDLFFAAPKKAPNQLLNSIDSHIAVMKTDSQSVYYASLKHWTSEEVRFQLPLWLQISGIALSIVLLMSIGGSIVLKHQVNVRTLALRQINREMEQRIIERTAQLEIAKTKAESADRLKSAFLAAMSHELRTPLNSIIGFTGIILQGIVGKLNEEQKKQLNIVRESARHLLSLINDVLDISKIEAGQMKINYESFDLPPAVTKVVESIRPLVDKKGLELTCTISPDVKTITADQRRVEQILLNLISNAVKFTEKGSVKINCELQEDKVTIKVIDTGIGIRSEDMEALFHDFRQIDSGMTRKYEGTGLGLSISKRLVELMGGQIQVKSICGEGSTFSFSLPTGGNEHEEKDTRD